MAGRGRGATLPAWMTQQLAVVDQPIDHAIGNLPPTNLNVVESNTNYGPGNNGSSKQFEDAIISVDRHGSRDNTSKDGQRGREREGHNEKDRGDRERSDRDRGDRDRGDRDRGDRDRSREKRKRSKSRSRSRSRDHRSRDKSPGESKSRGWKPRRDKPSNFDVRPPDGVILPPIAGVSMIADGGYSATSISSFGPVGGVGIKRDSSATTRHARRIYVGGIPQSSTEQEISYFFNDVCRRGLQQAALPNDGMPAVMNVYLNLDKCFAFVELPSIEMATAAQKLDGLQYKHSTGIYTLRIRRPHDYKPELVPVTGEIPEFSLNEFQTINTTIGTDGAGKVFVGGLPYHLADEQVKELLSAFGQLKGFNLVRDPGSVLSKGYAFCEYFDEKTTQLAIQGLNEMPIGDKRLTVRIAETRGGTQQSGSQQANPFMNINLGQAPVNPLLGQVPTKVLRLENMVTSDELQDDEEYEDILSDVREECSQYGKVQTVLIPRTKVGYPAQTEGFIFVLFMDIESSVNAAIKLYGRKFAERTVIVSYFDEIKFRNGILI